MDRTAVAWVGVAVAALVFADLLFVEVRRIVRELKRIDTRLKGYSELPILSLAATAEMDVARITAAADQMPLLIARGQLAIAQLRSYLPKGSSPG